MSLVWFTPDRATSADPARYADDLHVLGVRLCRDVDVDPSYQRATHPEHGRVVTMRIGQLTYYPTSGLIKAWPYRNVGDAAKIVLLGSASLAFHQRPCKAHSWRLRRIGKRQDGRPTHYWWTEIRIAVPADGYDGLWFANAASMIEDRLCDHALGGDVIEGDPTGPVRRPAWATETIEPDPSTGADGCHRRSITVGDASIIVEQFFDDQGPCPVLAVLTDDDAFKEWDARGCRDLATALLEAARIIESGGPALG
jgi:hypothetical protein